MTTTEALEELRARYGVRVAAIRADTAMTWEARERAIREAGREYDRERKAEEERGAARPKGRAATVHGTERSEGCATG